MDNLLNPLKAPFSTEAAANTTIAKVAVVYGLVGLIGGLLFTK